MTQPSAFTRRTLSTLGAAALLSGCAPEPAATTGSPRTPAPSSPPPSVGPAVCPTQPDVLTKPGNPQQYQPCNGTDIALTIDDGPHPVWTPKVLALLARHDIRATFCVVGANVAAHPDLIARLTDGGHQIANHTFSHPMDLATRSPSRIRPGAIILDHDGGGDRRQTVEALGIALPRLLDGGYRFVQP